MPIRCSEYEKYQRMVYKILQKKSTTKIKIIIHFLCSTFYKLKI